MTGPRVDAAPPAGHRLDEETIYAGNARRLVTLAGALAGPSAAEDGVSAAVIKAMTSPSWNKVRDPDAYLARAVVDDVRKTHRTDLRREAREQRVATAGVSTDAAIVPEIMRALAAL